MPTRLANLVSFQNAHIYTNLANLKMSKRLLI